MATLNIELVLRREAASVPLVRHILKSSLFELGVADEDVADVELAVTEACANAVLHAGGTPDEYEVHTKIEDDRCEIRVIDTGRGFDHGSAEQAPRRSDDGGRGLTIMRASVDTIQFVSEPERGTIVCLVKRLRFDGAGATISRNARNTRPARRGWLARNA
jgi:serine/threonine-protein kinase RsbW